MDVKTVRPPYADASIIACSREGGPAKISAWNRRLPQIAERALPNACGETPNRSPFALKHLVALLFLLFASFGFSQIQGMVRDSATLTGVAGAIVRIQDSDVSTLTNADGSFTLNDSGAFPYRVVAAKYGYYNGSFLIINSGGLTDLNIEIEPLPTTVSPDHPLNSPEDCGGCHPDQYEDWVLSPMATTGLNRWVFDVYNGTGTPGGMNGFVYQRDSVHRFANPNSDCSACHSPVHWLTDIVNAGMGDINLPNTAMENGVQCEVCHRALDVDETKLNFPGVDPEAFTFLRGNYNLEFGLLGDATYENNIMRPAYNPQLSAQLCAACHEDNVDHDDDGDFEDPGSVPHETTFSEWEQYRALNGPNAETCVSCHMPAVSPPRFCVFGEPRQRPIRSHDIRGTTPEFLENAVTMTVDASVDLASLTVDVAILNDGAGHSVPTGVVIRNALLAVEAFDQDGQRLDLASGDVIDPVGGIGDPSQGYLAGLPGYAFYLNMTDGSNERIFYTEATAIAADTRLKPGETYEGRFVFPLSAANARTADVSVRLIYRRSFRELLDVKGWTETGHGGPLADVQPPHYGHLMESDQAAFDVCGPKDLNGSNTVDMDDLRALNPQWGAPAAPFGPASEPAVNVKHFTALVNCIQ